MMCMCSGNQVPPSRRLVLYKQGTSTRRVTYQCFGGRPPLEVERGDTPTRLATHATTKTFMRPALCACLSVCLSVFLSVCLSVCLSGLKNIHIVRPIRCAPCDYRNICFRPAGCIWTTMGIIRMTVRPSRLHFLHWDSRSISFRPAGCIRTPLDTIFMTREPYFETRGLPF